MRKAISGAVAGALVALASSTALAGEFSNDAVKIGVLTDMEGPYSEFTGKGSVLAAQMAVEDFGGVVAGKKVEVVSGDHQNKPDVASTLARTWYDEQGVDLIVDAVGALASMSVQEIARPREKMLMVHSLAALRFTNEACSNTGINWLFTGYSKSKAFAEGLVKNGATDWYFITLDTEGGKAVQTPLEEAVIEAGGKVLGASNFPFDMTDFSAVLLQAQAADADIIAVAAGGASAQAIIRQGAEFQVLSNGARFLLPFSHITDISAIGLEAAQGTTVVEPFYWDLNDETRAWSRRFFEKTQTMPTDSQAGTYTAVLHYLKGVAQAHSDAGPLVAQAIRDIPVNDFMTKNGKVRIDGDVERQQYAFEVKKPSESKEPWDFYNFVAELDPKLTTFPLEKSTCSLVK